MESVYGDIGSVVSGGPPCFLASNWSGAVVSASNPTWPLDYPTLDYATETCVCPRFGSAPDPASLFQSAPPYLMFPNMIYPLPQDFDDMYKPSYESSIQLCQEFGSSPILISDLDSHIVPTPVFTAGLQDSPSADRPYGISVESSERNFTPGTQAMEMLQVATSMPSTFSLHSSVDRDYVKEESNNTAAFTTFGSANLAPSSPDSIPVPVDSTSSANEADKPTAMSIKEREDPESSSIQESRAESVVTTATNRKNHSLKRRKSQQKTVVCVPATGGADKPTGECVPTDSWSWRKYGQKPIKGSPYPRGYYRCSSSKGCPARKQVERSRIDPSMLILTYTSDHNHAWSAPRGGHAGTSRRNSQEKRNSDSPALPDNLSPDHDNQPISSIIDSPAFHEDHAVSPTTTTVERSLSLDQESDFDIANSDICRDDDFFAQLDELPDCFVMFRRSPLRERSDDEADVSQDVDPFNLFNWSTV